ncbi:MAG: TIGR02099 family protein [Gammaproteobacteria bacterium]|nr:TIGR02099 family protein [Gammaproteobacteria bacterium]
MIHIAKSLAIRLSLLLIVVAGLLIGALQLGAPAVAYFRGELEQWLGERLQRPVKIGELSARWRGVGPEFVFGSVEIASPQQVGNKLRLNEVRITLALLDSLRARAIKTRSITLSRVRLKLTRHADGSFTIGGLDEFSGEADGDSTSLFALPSRIRLEAAQLHFQHQGIAAEPMRFDGVDAELRNAGERHQLDAKVPLPGGGELALKVDVDGDISRPGGWNGAVHLDARGLQPQQLLRMQNIQGYAAPDGEAAVQLWGRWEQGRFVSAQGGLELSRLSLLRQAGMESPARRFDLERLRGDFRWQAQADRGWRLALERLEVTRGGRSWPTTEAGLEFGHDQQGALQLLAGVSFLRAEDLAALGLLFTPPGSELDAALRQMAPQSDLRELRFDYVGREAGHDWSLQGALETLNTRPWRQIPGVNDLDARFWIGPEQGRLQLEGSDCRLDFPHLFRDPLQLKSLAGILGWQRQANGDWQLQGSDIQAISHDISTRTRLDLTIPADSERSPFMDLQTDFSDGRALNAHRYYPVSIMPQPLVRWLDRGIVDGKVISGGALVRGPLRDFPFHKTQNGRFEVFFRTENTVVDYWPGWPRLTDIRAEVRFLQNSFDVWIEHGRIFDSELEAVHGRIDNLSGGSPIVIKGQVAGPLQNNLRMLQESPLAADFGARTSGLRAVGEGVTQLELAIPLSSEGRFTLDGAVDFNGGTLQLEAWQLALRRIHGKLNFDRNGIGARRIRADLLGSDTLIDIETGAPPEQATRIMARANISAQQLAQRFPTLNLDRLHGSADWTLRLALPHGGEEAASADFSSGLQGMRIDLPAPLGKRSDQQRDLNLSLALDDKPQKSLFLRYHDLLDAVLQIERQGGGEYLLGRGSVVLGGARALAPREPGLTIEGSLTEADLGSWMQLLGGGEADGGAVPLRHLKLRLARLDLAGMALEEVELELARSDAALAGSIRSRQLAGEILLPDNLQSAPLKVRLERLALQFDPARKGRGAPAATPPNPASIPPLDIEAAQTTLNDHPYGRLQLITRPHNDSLELQSLSLNSNKLQLSATGQWRQRDGRHQSRLQLSLQTESLGRVLRHLGYPHYIDDAPAAIDGSLRWPGTPAEFAQQRLAGEVKLQLGKGRLVNVDPGIGRVFGLINITALQRRLRLDFSDLFKQGLAFDGIEGRFELDSGDAYTNDLRVVGPAAMVESSGRIGLVAEDLDQILTVTPQLSAALPVAGLLAGGPIGGAAMLLAQGLIGKQFDRASQRQYEVKGPWSEPQMEPLSDSAETAQPDAVSGEAPDSAQPADSGGFLEGLKRQFTPGPQAFPNDREVGLPQQ